MITVEYDLKKLTLYVRGHAGYAPKGCDIVCAAVSALAYTLCRESEGEVYDFADGMMISVKRSLFSRIRFKTIVSGINMVSEKYPENVRISSKSALPDKNEL